MGFFIAPPYKLPANPGVETDLLYVKNGYEVWLCRYIQRIHLLKDGYRLAEILNNKLPDKYKGNYQKWIDEKIKKDMEKVKQVTQYIKELEQTLNTIQQIHGEQ